jgi:hypothetical protein
MDRNWIRGDAEGFAKYILDEINCHWHGRPTNPTKWLADLIKERDGALAQSTMIHDDSCRGGW